MKPKVLIGEDSVRNKNVSIFAHPIQPTCLFLMYWLRYLLREPFHAMRTAQDRAFMGLLVRYGDTPRHSLREVTFGTYRLRVSDVMSFLFQYKEIFADEYYYFRSATPQPVIVDCGANVGMSVLYFKKIHPEARIIAFEADPDTAILLNQNLAQNGVSGVEVVEKAVWTHAEGVSFGSAGADASSIFVQEATRVVPSVRLRDYLLREPQIDFLKIDIEGAEIEVLADCHDALGHVKHLFVEFHAYLGQEQSLASVIRVFEENGFRYYVDTQQHRKRPFVTHRYKNNEQMDLQLNIFGYRP